MSQLLIEQPIQYLHSFIPSDNSYPYSPNNNHNNNNIQIFNILLQKLYTSISNTNTHLTSNQISFFNQILFSRYNNHQFSENQLLKILLDKTDKLYNTPHKKQNNSLQSLQKISQIQTLYTKLSNLNIINNRWAVLYLLTSLSQSKIQEHNITLTSPLLTNNSDVEAIHNDIITLNEAKGKEIQNEFPFQSEITNIPNTTYSPIEVGYYNNTIINERDIINDLLFIFEGIDGQYISYSNKDNAYILNNIIQWNESIYDIVSFLCELGWLYKKVIHYVNYFNTNNILSQFIQSFSYAVQNELNDYYSFLSFLKKKNKNENIPYVSMFNVNNNNNINNSELTLKNLILWTMEPIERMKWLVISCESVSMLKGSDVLSQIYSYVKYVGAGMYLNKVLHEVSIPFYSFVRNWIQFGDLQDPYNEFFVTLNDIKSNDDIWKFKYSIIYKNIPNFISKELSLKIFQIGKCVHFLRTYCNEQTYSLTHLKYEIKPLLNNVSSSSSSNNEIDNTTMYTNVYEFLTYIENGEMQNESSPSTTSTTSHTISSEYFFNSLISNIDLIHKLINKKVVDIFYTKFHFKENLIAINRYLLLGQGDMMQLLMENLFDELKKPANQIYKHNLQASLDTAIHSSNAKYNDIECLKKLNIKLLKANTGDTGWDIFTLEYNVSSPLTVIFTQPLLHEYQRLFFFFWKLKRIEYSQSHQIWRKFMTYAHSLKHSFNNQKYIIHRAMLFNQQIIHFVSNLHNYLALEVLETQYSKLIYKLSTITSLDELIIQHKQFVFNVIEQSLLYNDNNVIYKRLLKIFEVIIRFRTVLDVLTTLLLEEMFTEDDNDNDNDNNSGEEGNGKGETYKEEYSKKAFSQIKELFEEFKNEVIELLNGIDYSGKGNMKYLKMKLDYNGYYSVIEKEKERLREEVEIEKMVREEKERWRLRKEEEDRNRREFAVYKDDDDNDNEGRFNDYVHYGEIPRSDGNNEEEEEDDDNEGGDNEEEEVINTKFNKKTYEVLNYNKQQQQIQRGEEEEEEMDVQKDDININYNNNNINISDENRMIIDYNDSDNEFDNNYNSNTTNNNNNYNNTNNNN